MAEHSKQIVTVIAVVALAFGVVFWAVLKMMPFESEGNLGDASSIVGAFFSALAFGGVLLALFMQKEELSLQRDELARTRDELAGQKAQLEAQSRSMSREVFEACFFQLLRLNRECMASHKALFPESREHAQGQLAFQQAVFHIESLAQIEIEPPPELGALAGVLAAEYARCCLTPNSDFSLYFRNLYHVVAFIDRGEMSVTDRLRYAKIVRAQLSTAEVILLFCHCQTQVGAPFQKFVSRYALFKQREWPRGWHKYLPIYPPEAYDDQLPVSA